MERLVEEIYKIDNRYIAFIDLDLISRSYKYRIMNKNY